MDAQFLPHNSHLEDVKLFAHHDSDLLALQNKKFVQTFKILEKFPIDEPGIFTLSGTFQSGKSTLLKSWMKNLLEKISPQSLVYFSCDLIENYHVLYRTLQKQIEHMPRDIPLFIILDEITAVRDWEKGIQPLAETGVFNRVILMLCSSDLALPKITEEHFSHYRGSSRQVDFQLNPLSFRETVLLKHKNEVRQPQILMEEFNAFLVHGGYLKAINDFAVHGKISDSTIKEYGDWLRNETERRGKHERYLREILNAIFKHYNSPITWNALAQELTIDHPKTIGDYLAMLESLDLVFIQYALLEKTLTPAPKKARKLMYTDPFVFHAMQALTNPVKNSYETQITEVLNNSELSSRLVESCVITQFRRYFPTYYIKAEGDVDLAYVSNQRFWPIEVTWSNQLRAKDLKQVLKYSNGRILTKTARSGIIQQIKTEPVPLSLWQLEDRNV